MREIKFRAKAENAEHGYDWYYDFLSRCPTSNNDFKYCICYWDKKYQVFMCATITQQDENTVGQFTGLYDKNGKEIYEGDVILHTLANEKYQVVWKDGKGFRLKRLSQMPYDDFYLSENFCKEYAEVLGNIWDNPELLKENK